jgi:mannose-6-phosphate isomerase-like protein (cupin superfamily)
MATVGQEISNPAARMRMRFTETAASSGGELVEVEATYEPGSLEPLEHRHPAQDEHFEIRAGTIRARMGGAERDLAPGETLDVPRGTVHAMWNPGDEPAEVLWQTRPALRTEQFFELVAALAASGELTSAGASNPLKGAAVMHTYRDVFQPANPPAPVRAIAFPALALVARALGQDPTRFRP